MTRINDPLKVAIFSQILNSAETCWNETMNTRYEMIISVDSKNVLTQHVPYCAPYKDKHLEGLKADLSIEQLETLPGIKNSSQN